MSIVLAANDYSKDLVTYIKRTEEESFNTFLMILALSSKEYITEDINKIYIENEINYYHAYQRGIPFKQSILNFPYKKMQTVRRLAGIVYYESEQGNFQQTMALIKKGVKPLWNYFKRNQNFSIDGYFSSRKKDFITDEESTLYDIAIAKFISYHHEGYSINGFEILLDLIDYKLNEGIINQYNFKLSLYLQCTGHLSMPKKSPLRMDSILEQIPSEGISKLVREMKKAKSGYEWYERFVTQTVYNCRVSINRHFESGYSDSIQEYNKWIDHKIQPQLDEIITNYINKHEAEGNKSILEDVFLEESVFEHLLNQDFLYTLLKSIDTISQEMGVRYTELLKVHHLSKETLEFILTLSLAVATRLDMSEREQQILVTFVIYTQFLIEDYLQLYQILSNGSYEENLVKVDQLSKELVKVNHQLNQEKARYHTKEITLINQINQLENQVLEYQKEKEENDLQKRIQELENEVIGLRQYLLADEVEEDVFLSIDEKIKVIKKSKILILGGHHNWQRKVKEILPFIEFVYVDQLNRNLN
ncbi:hypothetical protein V7127_25675, partial [Bacillus sp. JJ1773]|uniref:hypothetical protein n=1 Tax=Bacillus sp. JJ1773 TaxID=3122965 RepID=UPI002FFEFA7B